jgi:hypothetical protein
VADDVQARWDRDAADALRVAQQLREYHHMALWEAHRTFVTRFNVLLPDRGLEEPSASPNRNTIFCPGSDRSENA